MSGPDLGTEPGDEPDFTPEQVARGRALRRAVVPLALGSSAASLALLLALGLTSGGARLVGAFGDAWAPRVVGAAVTLVVLPRCSGCPSRRGGGSYGPGSAWSPRGGAAGRWISCAAC